MMVITTANTGYDGTVIKITPEIEAFYYELLKRKIDIDLHVVFHGLDSFETQNLLVTHDIYHLFNDTSEFTERIGDVPNFMIGVNFMVRNLTKKEEEVFARNKFCTIVKTHTPIYTYLKFQYRQLYFQLTSALGSNVLAMNHMCLSGMHNTTFTSMTKMQGILVSATVQSPCSAIFNVPNSSLPDFMTEMLPFIR